MRRERLIKIALGFAIALFFVTLISVGVWGTKNGYHADPTLQGVQELLRRVKSCQ
jgi:hypothetical protein